MNFIDEFIGKYDERSETIERAAGDLAFKLLWVLMLIVLMLIPIFMQADFSRQQMAASLFLALVAALMISLFVKYCYCWINNIARGRVIAKYTSAVVISTVLVLVILNMLLR